MLSTRIQRDCESSAKHGCYTAANDELRNAQIHEVTHAEPVQENTKPDTQ
jgi:hypothetical protein